MQGTQQDSPQASRLPISNSYVAYPSSVVSVDRKLQQVEAKLFEIVKQVGRIQMETNLQIYGKQGTGGNLNNGEMINRSRCMDKRVAQLQANQDHFNSIYKENMQKNVSFYERKLFDEKARHLQIEGEARQRIKRQEQQIIKVTADRDNLEKELQLLREKHKKLQQENEQSCNSRKNSKQKIAEMLMQQKQDLFQKYTLLQQETIKLLQFSQRLEQCLSRKPSSSQQHQNPNGRLSYITQIQLQASKYYSSLTNPMIQQIVNSFTQVLSCLHKKLQKAEQNKSKHLGTGLKGTVHGGLPMRLKSLGSTGNGSLDAAGLRDELLKIEKNYEGTVASFESSLNFEKEKTYSLKKKLQKLQCEFEQQHKQIQHYRHLEHGWTKKIILLQQQLQNHRSLAPSELGQQPRAKSQGKSFQATTHEDDTTTKNMVRSAHSLENQASHLGQVSNKCQSGNKENSDEGSVAVETISPYLIKISSVQRQAQESTNQKIGRQIEHANQVIRSFAEKQQKMQGEILQLIATNQNFVEQIKKHKESQAGMTLSLTQKQSLIAQKIIELDRHATILKEKEKERCKLVDQLKVLREEHNKLGDMATEEKAKIVQQTQALMSANNKLLKQIDELMKRNRQMQVDLQTRDVRVQQLQSDVAKQANNRQLTQQLKKKDQFIAGQMVMIQSLNHNINDLNRLLIQKDEARRQAQRQLEDDRKQLQVIRLENEQAKAQITSLKKNLCLQEQSKTEQQQILKNRDYKKSEIIIDQNDHNLDELNISQSKEISFMRNQILDCKQQLSQLLGTIHEKQQKIMQLEQKLAALNRQKFPQCVQPANINQIKSHTEQQLQKMNMVVMEQEQQLENLRIFKTKYEFLSTKYRELEETLQKEKEIYQQELCRNHMKIFELEDKVRKLEIKKRKVSSSEYFSLDPKNKFLSQENRSRKQENKVNTGTQRVPTEQNQNELENSQFHSFQEDFAEIDENKKETERIIDKDLPLVKVRKQKSQQYERVHPGNLKLCKLSSIEHYDSEQKSKQQRVAQGVAVPIHSQEGIFSPNLVSTHNEIKFSTLITKTHRQKQTSRQSPRQVNSHDQLLPHVTHSSSGARNNNNENLKCLSEQNRQLRGINQRLIKDITHLSQLVRNFERRWKTLKHIQNSHSDKKQLMSIEALQEQIKTLVVSKLNALQENYHNDITEVVDELGIIAIQIKRWVDMIEELSNLHKTMTLEMLLYKNYAKVIKKKRLKLYQTEDYYRRQRSVYSQGNDATEKQHMDLDYPEELQQMTHSHPDKPFQCNKPPVGNSLEILFHEYKESKQMSEISSVRHNSYTSGFATSQNSELRKFFEKGMKNQKEAKKQENKKDIVDEYILMNQNNQSRKNITTSTKKLATPLTNLQKIHSSSKVPGSMLTSSPIMLKNNANIYLEANNTATQRNVEDRSGISKMNRIMIPFQEKSSKSRRRILTKSMTKLSATNKKLTEEKKQFFDILKAVIEKYEDKLKTYQKYFDSAINQFLTHVGTEKTVPKAKSEKQIPIPELPKTASKAESSINSAFNGRISEKDELIQEKLQQLEKKIEKQIKQIENKDKIINELKQQLKEQKSQQVWKNKYQAQANIAINLRIRLEKKDKDFNQFVHKLILRDSLTKRSEQNDAQPSANLTNNQVAADKKDQSPNTSTMMPIQAQTVKNSSLKKIFTKKSSQNIIIGTATPVAPQKSQNSQKDLIKQTESELCISDLTKSQQSIKQEEVPSIKIISTCKNLQVPLEVPQSLIRVKSQTPSSELQKTKADKRSSNVSSEGAKTENKQGSTWRNLQSIFNFMQPSSSLQKKKAFPDIADPPKAISYQQILRKINEDLNRLINEHFRRDSAAYERSGEYSEGDQRMSKIRKDRQSKATKSIAVQEQQQKQKQKIKEEEQIFTNLKYLQSELKNLRQETIKRSNDRQQCTKEIMKQIIFTYRINKKSIEKLIDSKQKKQKNSLPKYLYVHALIKSVYEKLARQLNPSLEDSTTSNSNMRMSGSQQVAFNYQQFQSFEEKQLELQKQNVKLRQKIRELQQESQSLKIKQKRTQNILLMRESDVEEKFQQFYNKELFDNTKPSNEELEKMRKQLEVEREKVKEYQRLEAKRKNQKYKYIRKW